MYDGFCREWTPAYYVGDGQLFHVHFFASGVRGTTFIGVRTLEPLIVDSDGTRGTKMVKVPLGSTRDIVGFMELVRLKWKWLTGHRQ